MADYSSTPMYQPEISVLKDTLCAQQHLLQKLYNELDAEREASATAASEALSVILRLQGEKAAVKMEAEQYKRLAEEKMCHAEESFAIIDDIIYQKEMEVAALDYQVQAYRYKLLSMGCADLGGGEIKFPENLLQRSKSLAGDTSLGRRNSAPVWLKYKKAMVERESSLSPEPDLVSKNLDEQTGQEINDLGSDLLDKKADSSTHGGGLMSYGEETRKLDIRVKEIAGANYATAMRSPSSLSSRLSAGNLSYLSNLQPEARSPSPQLSINGNPYDPNKVGLANDINQIKHSRMPRKGEAPNPYPCSPSCVHDVFEVPQVGEKRTANNEIFQSKDVVHPEAVKLSSANDDQPDWLKKPFQSARNDKSASLCKPSHIAAIESRLLVNEILGISEVERVAAAAAESNNSREEELKLLKEIKEKLNLLQDEIGREKASKKSFVTVREKPSSICPLPEAMLHFWL